MINISTRARDHTFVSFIGEFDVDGDMFKYRGKRVVKKTANAFQNPT